MQAAAANARSGMVDSSLNQRVIFYPPELPVVERRHEIAGLIKQHQVLINRKSVV